MRPEDLLLRLEAGYAYDPMYGQLCNERDQLKAENTKLLWLVNDMCACFRIGAERDGVSKQWCYELFDSYTGKLRELGVEV